MKVAIDISPVIYGTGVSIYTRNLVKNLLEIDKANEYLLAGYSLRRVSELYQFTNTLGSGFEKKFVNLPPTFMNLLWNKLHMLNFEKIFGKCDIYHSSDWAQAPSNAYKVTTVHDLVPILYPQYSLPQIVTTHRKRLEWVKKEVDKIIVPSKQTLKDLVELGFDEKRVVVIHEAAEDDIKPASEAMKEAVKQKFSIANKYFLAIGVTPRKNIDRIIAAFNNLNAKSDLCLVVVGERKIDVKGGKNIIFTNHITKDELVSLYSGSIALVYPSLYEGFGLPILEAMKCQTPVITSNIGSMKELGEDSCVLVDPYSVESIKAGMESVLLEGKIHNLTKTLDKYTWKKAAVLTLGVYNEAN